MDGLLSSVSTSYTSKQDDLILEVRKSEITTPTTTKSSLAHASSPEEALEILKSEPNHEVLISTLNYLNRRTSNLDIRSPGPLASQLIQVLVSEIVPTFWNVLLEASQDERRSKKNTKSGRSDVDVLLDCLKSVSALSAITLNLKQLTQLLKSKQKQLGGKNSVEESLKSVLQLTEALLQGECFVQDIWNNITRTSSNDLSRKASWNELLTLLGGKLVGIVAEAEVILQTNSKESSIKTWISDNVQYANWIAQNISAWTIALPASEAAGRKAVGELLSKSFRLGHTGKAVQSPFAGSCAKGYVDSIIEEILQRLLLHREASPEDILRVLEGLPSYEQRNFLLSVFKIAAKKFLSSETVTVANSQWWTSDREIVAATAKLIATLVAGKEDRTNHVITWLTSSSGAGVGEGIALRRAVITAIAADKIEIETVLEKSLQQFGDQLYIKHVPSMQQEGKSRRLSFINIH
jgi:telomere length regulation protein